MLLGLGKVTKIQTALPQIEENNNDCENKDHSASDNVGTDTKERKNAELFLELSELISSIDINKLTPLEALNKLALLKERVSKRKETNS